MRTDSKYITVHSMQALESGEFSIMVGNIPFCNEAKVIDLFGGDPGIYLEYHNYKHNLNLS